jgi:hypothetical protein
MIAIRKQNRIFVARSLGEPSGESRRVGRGWLQNPAAHAARLAKRLTLASYDAVRRGWPTWTSSP